MPRKYCIERLTIVIPNQQHNPIMTGFPPLFTSFIMSVFRPMAAIARIIKNLLSSLKGVNIEEDTPELVAMVVIKEAKIK
jgi:hypothetical protein